MPVKHVAHRMSLLAVAPRPHAKQMPMVRVRVLSGGLWFAQLLSCGDETTTAAGETRVVAATSPVCRCGGLGSPYGDRTIQGPVPGCGGPGPPRRVLGGGSRAHLGGGGRRRRAADPADPPAHH